MGQAKGMTRLHKFPVKEVLPHIGKFSHKFWIPSEQRLFVVKHLSNQRMKLISKTQKCVSCLVEGTHFWLEKSGCWPFHFNLYAKNYYGDETLMTMDHIVPRSKGGPTSQDNLQLMCRLCNKVKKDHDVDLNEVLRRRFLSDPNLYKHVRNAYEKFNPEFLPILDQIFENRKCQKSSSPSQP